MGRFTTEDSYWGEDNNPLSLNLYTYCENDPIQYTDPTGHMTYNELVFYFGKEAAEKYKHEAEPDPTPKGITLSEVADVSTWSKDSSKDTFTINGKTQDLYLDNGKVYDSWGYERGSVQNGHVTVSDYEFGNLFGSSISSGSSSTTLTMNPWEHVTSVHTRDGSNVTINNYGIMDTITGGKNGSLVLNNYGKVNNEVRLGEKGTAQIYNNNRGSYSNNPNSNNYYSSSVNHNVYIPNGQTNSVLPTNVNLDVNGIQITDAVLIGNKTYVKDAEWLLKAMGLIISVDYNKRTIKAKNFDTGKYVTISFDDSVGEIAKALGIDDTLSWWHDDTGNNVTIQTKMNDAPVKVTRTGDTINIKAYINFTGDANDKFVDPSTGKPINLTYANVAAAGIQSYWSGTFKGNQFDFGNGKTITVNTQIFSNNSGSNGLWKSASNSSNKQEFLVININNSSEGVPHTDWEEPGQGLIQGVGQDSWSISNPGTITMYKGYKSRKDYTQSEYARTIAHEFGHILGLDDAYGYGPNASIQEKSDNDFRPEADAPNEVPFKKDFYNDDMMRETGMLQQMMLRWHFWLILQMNFSILKITFGIQGQRP